MWSSTSFWEMGFRSKLRNNINHVTITCVITPPITFTCTQPLNQQPFACKLRMYNNVIVFNSVMNYCHSWMSASPRDLSCTKPLSNPLIYEILYRMYISREINLSILLMNWIRDNYNVTSADQTAWIIFLKCQFWIKSWNLYPWNRWKPLYGILLCIIVTNNTCVIHVHVYTMVLGSTCNIHV